MKGKLNDAESETKRLETIHKEDVNYIKKLENTEVTSEQNQTTYESKIAELETKISTLMGEKQVLQNKIDAHATEKRQNEQLCELKDIKIKAHEEAIKESEKLIKPSISRTFTI